eukprot:gene24064-biopygen1321
MENAAELAPVSIPARTNLSTSGEMDLWSMAGVAGPPRIPRIPGERGFASAGRSVFMADLVCMADLVYGGLGMVQHRFGKIGIGAFRRGAQPYPAHPMNTGRPVPTKPRSRGSRGSSESGGAAQAPRLQCGAR